MIPQTNLLNNRERAYYHLRHAILIGEISYSHRLVDKDIALELGMSRMPVREALLQLKNEGFLETSYRGFVLKAYSPESIFDIFAVRLLLDPEAAYQACQVATDFQLRSLEEACSNVIATDQQGLVKENLLANWNFRRSWAQAVHNTTLKNTMDRLRDWAEQARLHALSEADFRHSTAQRIRKITDSFLNKDPKLAKQLVAENLIICRDKYCTIQAQLTANN